MQVRVFATLRDLLGVKQIEIPLEDQTTVRTVLRTIVADYPMLAGKLWTPEEDLTGYVKVMLNGRALEHLTGPGLETPVRPTDSLALFPPVGGG